MEGGRTPPLFPLPGPLVIIHYPLLLFLAFKGAVVVVVVVVVVGEVGRTTSLTLYETRLVGGMMILVCHNVRNR